MRISTLAIVGVGLIGGSIGLAAKRRNLAARVIGIDTDAKARQRALARGAVDAAFADLVAAREAELVVFCTPVDRLAAQILALAPHCLPGALLTDAGSTKAAIVHQVEGKLPAEVAFVGGHPLAGSEKQGVEHADADLFQGRLVVLTPSAKVNDRAVTQLTAFWNAVGAAVRLMSAEDHDRAVALTSHLPHVAASALASMISPEVADLAAAGFRDTTRIAAGSSTLWTGILRANRDPVLTALDRLEERLRQFRQAIETNDSVDLEKLLAEGKAGRDTVGR